MTAATDAGDGTAGSGSPLDRAVDDLEKLFGGIEVEGIDLAAANRLSFYVALQGGLEFASPSAAERAKQTLLGYLVFLRGRLGGTSPAERPGSPTATPGPPLPLFFFEGDNPSVNDTLRPVLAHFGRDEARAAAAYPRALGQTGGHAWIDLGAALPRRTGDSLAGLARAVRRAQTRAARAGCPEIFRRRAFRLWMMRSALRTAAAGRGLRRLFDAHPTSVLVTASDTSFWGRCATLEARRRGIPSLTLQHGMMVGRSAYVPVISNYFAAWGEASARWLQARGVGAEQIRVTGAPRLDEIINRTPVPRDRLAEKLRIDPAVRWIVLATNPIAFDQNAAMVGAALRGLEIWGKPAALVLKLHPSEDAGAYRALVGMDPGVAVVRHGEAPLYDLLATADAVLTFHSSVGLEAMMLDRPVVSLEAFGEGNPLPYAREGAAARARNPEELADALRREIDPGALGSERRERRARFIRDNLFAADGKSGERVRDLVRALAEGGAA